ncbi:MAG: DEAD/DEAH box helicase, partial [Pseudomonadales bacterium]|nr:DEAD/DEAH box helicase [Pseudomonadales bacterium]
MPNPIFPDIQIPTNINDHRKWGGLKGCAVALAISEAAAKHKGISVVITADTRTAQHLAEEISFFSDSGNTTLHFPDWEILPYDNFSPHQDIISQRLKALQQLPQLSKGILIVPVSTMMARISPPEHINRNSFVIEKQDTFDLPFWRNKLSVAGYHAVDTVFGHGEYAIRGSILDLFPMGSNQPVRVELFDDHVESLRLFDPDTQRSSEEVERFELLPAKEFPLTPEAISRFKSSWRERFDVDHRNCPVYQDVSEGIATAGLEYYLPLFHDQCATLADYLPSSTLLFTLGDLSQPAKHFWDEIGTRYENLRFDITRPLLSPAEIAQAPEQLFSSLKTFPKISLSEDNLEQRLGSENFASTDGVDLYINAHLENPFKPLNDFLDRKSEQPSSTLFTVDSAGRREGLLEQLQKINVQPKVFSSWQEYRNDKNCPLAMLVAPLEEGVELSEPPLSIITESQLYGHQVQQKRRRKKASESADLVVKNLTELKIGAPVVHLDHGVGRYCGLQTLVIDAQAVEFLTLEYASDAKLYVPVSSLHLISRYSGADADSAPLHRLGTETWQKERRKAAEKAHDVAAELLDIYARRAAKEGYRYDKPALEYTQFCSEFPFEETPDQQSAIEATVADMTSQQPMDRLICGDVGFGKTEVAMRATFVATQNNKQVAILVPTTLLAQQHYESFKDRFADWPIKVEVLSRFKTAKEQQATLKLLESGHVDI